METIRNAFDYALYQQTTEMLLLFIRDLAQSNLLAVRQQSHKMAAEFTIFVAQSSRFNEKDKTLLFSGLSTSLSLNE
ncbi:hypothetical protein [Shewanella phaeophyticola]|uniref:Uncharacterized protein n=1 Tax=Shewanella phaeophyticola TaxID=2978345 RepID=A0ABT2NYP7_9GAMM|nr:hypothetical protein [Shewanella sp. KJ10-1]MCT8985513.1 hypothetical protein [Shewanella sp. KJ10-1]